MMWVIIVILILLTLVVVFIGLAVLLGYYEVKKEPRGPMMMCNIHGPISERAIIEWLGQKTCGLCFHKKSRDAEKGML